MSFLGRVFFESPIWLGGFCFLLFAVSLFVRRRGSEAVRRWAVPGAIGLTAALFAVQRLVVTEAEEVRARLGRLVAALEGGDDDIASLISDRYDSEGMDHAAVVSMLESVRARIRIYDTRFHRQDVAFESGGAVLVAAARTTVRIDNEVGQVHWGAWRIGWAQVAGEWRITSIRPVMIDGASVTNLREVVSWIR